MTKQDNAPAPAMRMAECTRLTAPVVKQAVNPLIENVGKLHTTGLGAERVRRNLQLETDDVVQWCRARILDGCAEIERTGKTWYVTAGNCRITVNAHSYTIITAHKVKKSSFNP